MKTPFQILFDAVQPFPSQTGAQSDEQYIKAFAVAISKIPDEPWSLLPLAATDWYSNTARCINAKKPFSEWPPCPGFVSVHPKVKPPRHAVEIPGIKEEEELPEEGVIDVPKSEPFPKAPEPKKRIAPKNSKFSGAIREIRRIVMIHPEWSARTIHKYLDAAEFAGIKFDMVSVVCSETRAMILIAKDLGFWRDISIYDKDYDKTKETKKEAKQGASS